MRKIRDKKIKFGTAMALCVLAAVTGAVCSYAALTWPTQAVQNKLREIDHLVKNKYIGELDEKRLADYAAAGYIAGINDKWSAYIPATEYKSYTLLNEGKNCGIGVSIITRNDSIRVSAVYIGSPAEEAGIERGDYIVGAEGLTVEQDGATAVVAAIQGEEGESVRVSVRKNGTETVKELTMTRALVTQKMAWGELAGELGYLRIENFHVGSAEQFQEALEQLQADGAKALVIDVRHNGGGRVKEMSEMLDLLLPEGLIMTLTTRDGHDTFFSSDADMADLPVVVLIDEQSISAAEFFAAALQEYDRAELVGTHTTGKGRAQQTFRLSDGSAVNLSVEEYFTPKGNSLADVGIAPDVTVTLTEEQMADFYFLSPEEDPQRRKADELARAAIAGNPS